MYVATASPLALSCPGTQHRHRQHHREIWQPGDHCFAIHPFHMPYLTRVARGRFYRPAAPFSIFSICS